MPQECTEGNGFMNNHRAILISANVIINCFLCLQKGRGWYIQSVRNLIRKTEELKLIPYMTELDKKIAWIYCTKLRSNVRDEDYEFIQRFIYQVRSCPITASVIDCASYLESVHSPDAIRLAAAFEHDLVVVTWEPTHFASSPKEIHELNVQRYTRRHIGNPEGVENKSLEDYEGQVASAGVWIFSVASFSNILDSLLDRNISLTTNVEEIFEFSNYELNSSSEYTHCEVVLLLSEIEVRAVSIDIGLVDAILTAIRSAIEKYYELPQYELNFSVLDTWEVSDTVEVQVSCRINDKFYSNIQNSINLGTAVGHAYVSVLNAIIDDWNLPLRQMSDPIDR